MRVFCMSGAGNDFVVTDVRDLDLDLQELAIRLCQKYQTDGFLALDHSDVGDFRLHFYNADGLRGEMCGNGARCICRFAYDRGIAGEAMTVQTDAGLVYGWRLDTDRYRVALNPPSLVDTQRKPGCAYVELGDPGIPHCLVETPDLVWEEREALREKGSALRYDPAFPKGANVTFYRVLETGRVRVLTYERGVEDYTLACGTGCGSLATVLYQKGMLPGGQLIAENPGGTLTLQVEGEGRVETLLLEGPVTYLGQYEA